MRVEKGVGGGRGEGRDVQVGKRGGGDGGVLEGGGEYQRE